MPEPIDGAYVALGQGFAFLRLSENALADDVDFRCVNARHLDPHAQTRKIALLDEPRGESGSSARALPPAVEY